MTDPDLHLMTLGHMMQHGSCVVGAGAHLLVYLKVLVFPLEKKIYNRLEEKEEK